MQNRDRGGRSGGRRSGGRFDDRGPKQMHQATCADCGDTCEVPFKPRGDRPIYCSNCFGKHNPRDDRRGGGNFQDRGDRQMFRATCDNCGNDCEVPFRPTGEKPVYCKDCFGNKDSRQRHGSSARPTAGGDVMTEIKSLNKKLDKILSVIAPTTVHVIPLQKEATGTSTASAKSTTKKKVPTKKKSTTKKKAGTPKKKKSAKKK